MSAWLMTGVMAFAWVYTLSHFNVLLLVASVVITAATLMAWTRI